MDPNSLPVPENHKKKILAFVGLGIIGFFIVLITIVSLLSQKSETIIPDSAPLPPIEITPVSSKQETSLIGSLEFTIPSGWEVSESTIQNGNRAYIFPKKSTEKGFPKIIIEVTDSNILNYATRKKGLLDLDFVQEKGTSIGSTMVEKFHASLPFAIKDGKPDLTQKTQQSYILFPYKNEVYVVGYEYLAATSDSSQETFFSDFISSSVLK